MIHTSSIQSASTQTADETFLKEYARLEGVWRFVLVEVEGVKQPELPFETNKLIIAKDGRFTIAQGRKISRGILKLDPTKTPGNYDFTVTNGPDRNLTTLGVYEVDGDTFRICLPLRSKERPSALVSSPGGGCLFQVFKLETRDVKKALMEATRLEAESIGASPAVESDAFQIDEITRGRRSHAHRVMIVHHPRAAFAHAAGAVIEANRDSLLRDVAGR